MEETSRLKETEEPKKKKKKTSLKKKTVNLIARNFKNNILRRWVWNGP